MKISSSATIKLACEIGAIVALRTPVDSSDRFWLAKVIAVNNSECTCQWYEKLQGKYYLQDWYDQNPLKSIIDYDVQLFQHKLSKQQKVHILKRL